MKRFMVFALVMFFSLSGCVIRTNSYKVDRVDQEIKGNRGVLKGSASDFPTVDTKKTRKMYNIEIELFSPLDVKKTIDKDIKGNRGYLIQKKGMPNSSLKVFKVSEMPQIVFKKAPKLDADPKKEEVSEGIAKEEKKEDIYVVQKGDSLQNVSNKFYGTTKKWKKIYERNKDVLKSPDMIKAGQKLVIPLD